MTTASWFDEAREDARELLILAKRWSQIDLNEYDLSTGWTEDKKMQLEEFVDSWLSQLDKPPKFGSNILVHHIYEWFNDRQLSLRGPGYFLREAAYLLSSAINPY